MNPTSPAEDIPSAALLAQCQGVLRANDRGGYTVPSSRLYPFQWNWDAAINALGWQTFDEPRAWSEVEWLLKGQWANGMVPSIVFHKPADSYFPGPGEWGSPHTVPTTSISQPPVLSTMVRQMAERSHDPRMKERLVALLPGLFRWHQWWYTDRDPEGTGLVATYHPWETGNDNSPAWDVPLRAVPPTSRNYQRQDTGVVDSSMRPHKSEYDRFVYLLDFFRDCCFDAQRIYQTCPFRVVDFSINAILLRASIDLQALCREADMPAHAEQLGAWIARARKALETLWDEDSGRYLSLDTRSGLPLECPTHATFLAWYAALFDDSTASQQRQSRLLRSLQDQLDASRFGLTSTHVRDAGWDPRRYWRGPVWPHINWLVAQGLTAYGHAAQADKLRADTLQLVSKAGLYEYFSPDEGEGCGGPDFSWTAAIVLLWQRAA